MIDIQDIKKSYNRTPVYFKNLPAGDPCGAIYIENEYHKKINNFLRLCAWGLWNLKFRKYEYGYAELVYIPRLSSKIKQKHIRYLYPFLPKKWTRQIPEIKTADLLNYLEDPDDVRFLHSGFLFFRKMNANGISVYDYYPIPDIKAGIFNYIRQIEGILGSKKDNSEQDNNDDKGSKIGNTGLYCIRPDHDEDYADNICDSLDTETRTLLAQFKKQAYELQELGVPMAILENILHQNDKLSKLIISKEYDILLPDYNNLVIKMEPIVKAVYFLFLRHPEGLMFKELPDYRKELTDIYLMLKPNGLTEKVRKSIDDVTDPTQNSINEKCARIRGAFIQKFDEHLARYYYIDGRRAQPKKIALPRELVIWER